MHRMMGPAFFLTLLFAALSSAHAQKDEGAVTFCFNNWPPYTQMVEGKPAGLSVEILREAAARTGLRPTFVELPWNRCLQSVRGGYVDAVIDAAPRAEFLQGPASFSVYTNTFWVRDNDPLHAFDLPALQNYRIGLVNGYVYPKPLHDALRPPAYQIEYSVDDPANVMKLGYGRVDAIIGDYIATRVLAREHRLSLRALQPPHSFDRLYPSFNRNRADLHKRIDVAIAAMIKEGFVDEIYHRRFGISLTDLIKAGPASR